MLKNAARLGRPRLSRAGSWPKASGWPAPAGWRSPRTHALCLRGTCRSRPGDPGRKQSRHRSGRASATGSRPEWPRRLPFVERVHHGIQRNARPGYVVAPVALFDVFTVHGLAPSSIIRHPCEPRISDWTRGKISRFSLDKLLNMLSDAGLSDAGLEVDFRIKPPSRHVA